MDRYKFASKSFLFAIVSFFLIGHAQAKTLTFYFPAGFENSNISRNIGKLTIQDLTGGGTKWTLSTKGDGALYVPGFLDGVKSASWSFYGINSASDFSAGRLHINVIEKDGKNIRYDAVSPIPEPPTFLMLFVGMTALGLFCRRKSQ